MAQQQEKAALSQVEYLEKQFQEVINKIKLAEVEPKSVQQQELHDLYFQKGKLYSEIELMKRVPSYD
ncbi:hypothetical protein C2I27_03780 [Priestia megaterium]|jgi:hypothetical protein|uniref:hypothetical protein n=1 Tax=Priestia megaterium TaxID=1404 RepID=UPI000D50FB1F|nr:hypothetical protein [Priestia megaterium]MEB2276958.1 hypothetical protein [Bacillus sp. ILBB4]PVC75017.1 hypothetical protein C2I27_03780 [Priestia megaterium]